MYEIFLFDLDGTITDPAEGITNSVAYALEKWGISIRDKSTLNTFIGPPLYESFMKYFDFSESDAIKAVEVYREYFSVKGIYENKVYDCIEDALSLLKSAGKKIAIATSKPECFAIEILEYFSLDKYFDVIAGATMDGSRINKDDVINYALKQFSVTDKSKILMIGDRKYDVNGAKSMGIDSLAVAYGYGAYEELENANPTFMVDNTKELLNFLKERIL